MVETKQMIRASGAYWVRFCDQAGATAQIAYWTDNGYPDLSSWSFFGQEASARDVEVDVLSERIVFPEDEL